MMLKQSAEAPPEMAPNTGINIKVYNKFDVVMASEIPPQAWDEFVQTNGGDVYLSYDWCRIWWDHYGANRQLVGDRQLRVFAGREKSGRIIGLLPMFVETIWVGPAPLRWAKIIGCDFLPSVLAPVIERTYAAEFLTHVISHLVERDNCDAVVFGPISQEEAGIGLATQVRRAANNYSDRVTMANDAAATIHTTFRLPSKFDAYLETLNKRQRQNLRRDLNLFDKTFKINLDAVTKRDELIREFEAFCVMHDQQWSTENKLGHFGDWPVARSFNDALIRTLAPLGRARLVRLWADQRIVSYQYCLTFGDRLYWRLPARVVGVEWNRFGMGRLGLIKMIEMAIHQGFHWIEGGPGHYEYKVQLGGQEIPILAQVVVAKNRRSQLRWKIFHRLSRLLHLLYYRIWFLKVVPKIGEIRGEPIAQPLWPLWIRTRY